ncbi:cell cycle checkpoint protein RAD17 [Anopheles stephensi]|uniref:cell cycle checkpoint protein RAD17 n=1 Tax=Anopheles stephensi TaxID=30069 RepID=UPI001658851D|nr:cell cycle checkpoint protein RAD17 [Anopheles stephensi]XP_035913442.1 cell cycle checkpoint protein RAD17 [Anopheles stephensi]
MQKKSDGGPLDLLEHFKPSQEADLAIHVKKIEEVKLWLTEAQKMHPASQILLITGPSGSGKSICLKTLAQAMNYGISEWTTPVDVDLFLSDGYDFEDNREDRKGRRSQKALFNDFLYKTSRYCSLFSTANETGRLLLVKDFPNSMLRSPEEFHDSLERFRDSSTDPIVFIATDTASKSLDVAYNLFPATIMESFQIHHIKFNAVSATLLKKAIKRITGIIRADAQMSKLYQAVPSRAVEEDIVASSQGDLRNCCLNYLFTCMKSEAGVWPKRLHPTGDGVGHSGKKKKSTAANKNTNPVGLSENLTIMHGLGRIFHPKFVKQQHEGTRFVHSPESIAECFLTQPASIVSLLHSNYVTRCSDIQNVSRASDALTVVDAIMNEFRSDQLATYGLNIAVRSMMVYNEQTTHGFQPIRKKIKVQLHESTKAYEGQLIKHGLILRPVPTRLLATEYKGYVSIIWKPALNKSHSDAVATQ